MKNRLYALACALLVSGAAVMGVGAYLKYGPLHQIAMVQDLEAMEVPFMLLADHGLRYTVRDTLMAEETEPAQTVPVQTEETTQPVPEETTLPPVETTSQVTETTTPETTVPTETAPQETMDASELTPETVAETKPWEQDFEQGAVDPSWFDDMLFIGDSRVVGLRDYARSGGARYFCVVGMNVFDYDQWSLSDEGTSAKYLNQVLEEKQYGKVFINLGLNECGYPVDTVMKAYEGLVALVRSKLPDAKIILHGILTVGKEKVKDGEYFSPANLALFNERIATLADGETIFYMNVDEIFADEEGYLPEDLSWDGCHLYADYLSVWAKWIGYKAAEIGI